jgi:2-dehydropantoate 2-reductase
MDTIRRVAILGAGAMGAMYAAHLQKVPTLKVWTVARGERAERLRRDGVTVNDEHVSLDVFDPGVDAPTQTVDLVLVAVKHHHLEAALADVQPLVGQDTIFLSVLNGLDSEPAIDARFGDGSALLCIALGMDAVRVGQDIKYANAGTLTFGEPDNTTISERVERVQHLLDAAGLGQQTPADMRHAMWWKFMVNVGINQASALCRAPYAVMRDSPDANALMRCLIDEVVALSHREGVPLGEDDVARWFEVLEGLDAKAKTSMLQDIEAGRETEVDIFAGKIVRLGEQHGVPTPNNRFALLALRGLTIR